jgi:hypothetical protein
MLGKLAGLYDPWRYSRNRQCRGELASVRPYLTSETARRFTPAGLLPLWPADFFFGRIATKQVCEGSWLAGWRFMGALHVRLQLTCGRDAPS